MDEFQEIFLKKLSSSDPLHFKKEALLSYEMDLYPVQDSFRYRARRLGHLLAHLLIDESGELIKEKLQELESLFKRFLIGPKRENEALIYRHIHQCLISLAKEKSIWSWVKKFSIPVCHKKAEELIRNTLWPQTFRALQTVHVRRAVLAAWFTLLRQATGSCFATAPAIFIQAHEPERFFKDLYDLLSTGQLKRVVFGKEFIVPLNTQAGLGELQKVSSIEAPGLKIALESVGCPIGERLEGAQTIENWIRSLLLKGMGLNEEDVQAEEQLSQIQMTSFLAKQGAVYYQKPSERFQKVSEWKKKRALACQAFICLTECVLLRAWEYTIACLCDVKTDFTRWNLYIGLGLHPDQKEGIGAFIYANMNALFQKEQIEMQQLDQSIQDEMRAIQALEVIAANATDIHRNQLKAEWTSRNMALHSFLERKEEISAKLEALNQFFPSLLEQYDQKLQQDFQELFDPALSDAKHFFCDDSPAGFRLVYKHGRGDSSQWTTIYTQDQYIQSLRDLFLKIENDVHVPDVLGKPFLSNLTTALVQFIQSDSFIEGAKKRALDAKRLSPWNYVSGGTMQTLLQAYYQRNEPFTEKKVLPQSQEDLWTFIKEREEKGPLLMHSPTHAFLFQPEKLERKKPLELEGFNELEREYLLGRIAERLRSEDRPLFLHRVRQKHPPLDNRQFREQLIECFNAQNQWIALIDSVFYECTPLFSEEKADRALNQLIKGPFEPLKGNIFGAYELFQKVKLEALKKLDSAFSDRDLDVEIAQEMRDLGFLRPEPAIFADTNWSGWLFAFIANPVTLNWELWRVNRNGTQAAPMVDFREWLQEKNGAPWILLSNPKEYGV